MVSTTPQSAQENDAARNVLHRSCSQPTLCPEDNMLCSVLSETSSRPVEGLATAKQMDVTWSETLSRDKAAWSCGVLQWSTRHLLIRSASKTLVISYDHVRRLTLHPAFATVFGLELFPPRSAHVSNLPAAVYVRVASIPDMMEICDPIQDYMRRTRDGAELIETQFVACM